MFNRRDLVLLMSTLVLCAGAAECSYGAVIYSSCLVESHIPGEAAVDRFKADGLRSGLRNYSQEVPRLGRYLRWLLTSNEQLAKNRESLNADQDQLREIGRLIEDIQFASSLATGEGQPCHSAAKPKTWAMAIFPFVMRNRDAQGAATYRVRYKLCEYYVDQRRQLPIENACTILGREQGYAFTELEQRFVQLQARIEEARESVKLATYGVGALASLTVFKVFRGLNASRLSAATLSLLPAGGTYLAVRNGLSDEFIRNAIDFKDAAEVAITGDLTTAVSVDMPIQDFTPFFVRYLEGMEISYP